MNFLGHIFLTPNDNEILLGNFIADSVKGTPERSYSGKVAEGIRFHRAIDHFTDRHPLVKQGVDRFRETQNRFAPVAIDVIYDHILARHWNLFHPIPLHEFTQATYAMLDAERAQFPAHVSHFFPFMKEQDWLYNYQFEWGILKALHGLDRRATHPTQMYLALDVYKQHEEAFLSEFSIFILDAKKMSEDYFSG